MPNKICRTCKETKSYEEFDSQKGNADGTGRRSYCKICYKGMRRKYYEDNHEAALERAKKTRLKLEKEFKELKKKLKCEQCGEDDWRCLDFHHTDPTQKLKSVRRAFFNNGKQAAKDEADKCQILCANCHRKHHMEPCVTKQDIADQYPMIGDRI